MSLSDLPEDPDPSREEVRQTLAAFESAGANPTDLVDQTLILDGGPDALSEALKGFASDPIWQRPDSPPPTPAGLTRLRALARGDDPLARWTDTRLVRYLAIRIAQIGTPDAGILASQIREILPENHVPEPEWDALADVLVEAEQQARLWEDEVPDALPILRETRDTLNALRPLPDRVWDRLPDAPSLPSLPKIPTTEDLANVGKSVGGGLILGGVALGLFLWAANQTSRKAPPPHPEDHAEP